MDPVFGGLEDFSDIFRHLKEDFPVFSLYKTNFSCYHLKLRFVWPCAMI